MSNVKQVHVEGWMPFDGGQSRETYFSPSTPNAPAALIQMLGEISLPSFGLKVTYSPKTKKVPNKDGGETTMYFFTILGTEAVSERYIDRFCHLTRVVGGEISHARVWDMENDMELLLKEDM